MALAYPACWPFYPMNSFNSGLAANAVSPTYAQLYSGVFQHPGSMAA
jgi:hypothetical protein